MKRTISFLLAVLMMFTLLPLGVLADEVNAPAIRIESVYAQQGKTVSVDVKLENNPGIISTTLEFSFPEGLSLVSAESGEAFRALNFTQPAQLSRGEVMTGSCRFVWVDSDIDESEIKDGTILTLTFEVSEDAALNENFLITLACSEDDTIDKDGNSVAVKTSNGYVSIIDYTPCDVNDDNDINMKDVVMLCRYIVDGCTTDPNGYNVTINDSAANVNGDYKITMLDAVWICRYFVDGCISDPNGYYIIPLPSPGLCKHTMEHHAAVAATCEVKGNIEYWYCTSCEKYYTDADGRVRIALEDTVIAALGHDPVLDEGYPATVGKPGLTDGYHCGRDGCGKILVAQEIIEPLEAEEYNITYKMPDDSYLLGKTIENTNPNKYKQGDKFDLAPLSVEGYDFAGWYDESGNKIDAITADMTGNIVLTAKFNIITYKLQFTVSMEGADTYEKTKIEALTKNGYTVKDAVSLPVLTMDKYTFAGWTDEEGNFYSGKIPAGTTGNLILKDNWISDRNRAKAVSQLDDPLVVEDSANQMLYFCYEIGTIENVPLYTVQELLCANGVITCIEETTSHSIGSQDMTFLGKTVSLETTNSTQFTLSKELTDITEVSKTYIEQNGYDSSVTDTEARSQSNTTSVSSSASGSLETYNYNDKLTKDSTNQNFVINQNLDAGVSHELTTGFKNTTEASAGISLPTKIINANAGVKNTTEISANTDTKAYMDYSVGSTYSWDHDTYEENYQANSVTAANSWNTATAQTTALTVSQETSVTNAIHELVSNEYGYGQTYSQTLGNSEMRGTASSEGSSTESSSTFVYTVADIETKTTSFTTTGNTKGSYRIVKAGTLHVFAVVGYDVAAQEYFVYTYNVLGDGTCNDGLKDVMDYSYTGTFDDYENSVIEFEVPMYVNDFVNSRIVKTEGIEYTFDNVNHTAVVSEYVGTDKIVYIPSYVVDAEGEAFTVTGIEPTAFKLRDSAGYLMKDENGNYVANTDIVAVSLGRNIKEIPAGLFEGCTSLEYVICPAVTSIGDNAFAGCESLAEFRLSKQITNVGTNAFDGVISISATVGYDEENEANSIKAAENIAASGAKSITLDISAFPSDAALAIKTEDADSFSIDGGGNTFSNITIESHAKSTEIRRFKIVDAKNYPLALYSDKVKLYQVDISGCSSFAMLLGNDNTELTLSGTNSMATNGANAIVCGNVNVLSENSGKLNVSGNVLICGELTGLAAKFAVTNGEFIDITEEVFANYKKGVVNITLDAGEGTLAEAEKTKTAIYGTAIGELPTPTRDNFIFDGWYTEDGIKVTEDYEMAEVGDITLYAYWISDWVLETEVPAGAETYDSKYTYTLRSYTTDSNQTLDGWTLYDTQRTAWGDEIGPVYTDPSNGERSVRSEQYVKSSNYKTIYHYYRYASVNADTGGDSSNTNYGSCVYYREIALDYQLSSKVNQYGTTVYLYEGTWWYFKCNPFTTQQKVSDNYATRWYYQEPIYTYFFYQDNSLESTEYPTSGEISNVQHWVQYRAK